jgi:peptidoglycan/LPS O-acetylase OafA/YrhL
MEDKKPPAPLKLDFYILDGLRGIAAVYVVFNHCRGHLLMGGTEYSQLVPVSQWGWSTKLYYAFLQVTSLGREFVIFFFVLSGFSIAHSLTKNKEALPFYKRRAIRLYPPYVLALIWAAVIFYLLRRFAPMQLDAGEVSVFHDLKNVLLNLVYVPKGALIPQFWSLTHEVIFYLLIPLLFTRSLKYYVWLSVAGYIAGWMVKWNGTNAESIPLDFLLNYNIFFVIGILVYRNMGRVTSLLKQKMMWFLFSVAGLFVLMIALKLKLGEYNKVTLLVSALLSILMIVNFLAHSVHNKLLHFLGKMSYTIYISHFASLYLFIVLLSNLGFPLHSRIREWYIWPLAVIVCLLLSIPLYYMAEHPTKKILSRLRK